MVVMGPIECAVCNKGYDNNPISLVQIQYDTFICKPCIAVWYNDWKRMVNPWPHLPIYAGENNDACDDKPSSL